MLSGIFSDQVKTHLGNCEIRMILTWKRAFLWSYYHLYLYILNYASLWFFFLLAKSLTDVLALGNRTAHSLYLNFQNAQYFKNICETYAYLYEVSTFKCILALIKPEIKPFLSDDLQVKVTDL